MNENPNPPNTSSASAANAGTPPQSAGAEEVSFLDRLHHWLTAQPVVWLFLVTFACVVYLNPAKIGLLLWGITKLAAFAYAGDWIDSRVFPSAAPEALTGPAQGTAWKRKGMIVAAAIVAGAMLP